MIYYLIRSLIIESIITNILYTENNTIKKYQENRIRIVRLEFLLALMRNVSENIILRYKDRIYYKYKHICAKYR